MKTEHILASMAVLAGAGVLSGCSTGTDDDNIGEIRFKEKMGMLVNLNKCIGCAACVMACKLENGTQQGVYWNNINFKEVEENNTVKRRVQPTGCNHCTNAPCIQVCPTGASHFEEDGTVQVDMEVCIGCHKCVIECPYKARQFNYAELADNPAYKMISDRFNEPNLVTPFEQAKSSKHKYLTAEKCTFCKERRKNGEEPACVETCPTKARVFGNVQDSESVISKEIARLDAKPINSELGTKPSFYYAGKY